MSDATVTPTDAPSTPPLDPWALDIFAPASPAAKPIEIDVTEVEFFSDRDSLQSSLHILREQACVVLALRAAKRVSVFVELRNATTEAIAAGFVIEFGRRVSAAASAAYAYAAVAYATAAYDAAVARRRRRP